jgi:integrase
LARRQGSITSDKQILRWLHPYLADRELIEKVIEAKQAEGCSNGTSNRVLALMRAILRRCERAWVHPDQAKARRAIAVPLNDMAMNILGRQVGLHPVHVFSYLGKPIFQVSTKAWYRALERAGIEDFRFHDLRHT